MTERILHSSGFWTLAPASAVMLAIAFVVLYLAVSRKYEPLMLVPIAFGMLLGNLPAPAWVGQTLSAVNQQGIFGMSLTGLLAATLPPLIFLGLGAQVDLAAMLSRPKTALLGAAAQVGTFVVFVGAVRAGLAPDVSAAMSLPGGASGPMAMFAVGRLAPALLVPVALAAYSLAIIGPLVLPAVSRLMMTRRERGTRMAPGRSVSGAEAIACPIAGLLVTALLVPSSLPLLGAFFFGNLLKVSGATTQLAKTAANTLTDMAMMVLGLGLGASASAGNLLTRQSAQVFGLGLAAFAIALITGVLCARILNRVGTDPVNPLVGAAAACPWPAVFRAVEAMGVAEDSGNHLQPYTAGPGAAGLIASTLVASVFLGLF